MWAGWPFPLPNEDRECHVRGVLKTSDDCPTSLGAEINPSRDVD